MDVRKELSRRDFLKATGLALTGSALAGCSWNGLSERRQLAAMSVPPAGLPNVLLIVLDTVRAQSLSLYGYDRPTTPRLQQVASESLVFDMALSTAPWTLPSHASIFTGRYPFELFDRWWTPLSAKYPTLAEVLGQLGYLTSGFIANTLYCSRDHGLDRGFQHYEDFRISPGQALVSSALGRMLSNQPALRSLVRYQDLPGRKTADMVNQDFLRWLDKSSDAGRPFFAFLNYFDAHEPFLPPEDFAAAFRTLPRRRLLPRMESPDITSADIRFLQDSYDAAIAYLDDRVSGLLEELRNRDQFENTITIITSDHGEHFGEHNLMAHANSLYIQLLKVPLMVCFPREFPGGRRLSTPVSLQAIPATILDLIGQPNEGIFPSHSWRSLWAGQGGGDAEQLDFLRAEVHQNRELPASPVQRGDLRSLMAGSIHYIRNMGDGQEELFDLEADPHETVDISESNEELLLEFRNHLLNAT